jgi:hypothetical protein
MANLIVTPARGGGYTVIDADRQVEVAFFQNQNVANDFAAQGQATAQAIQIASVADVRTSGGPLGTSSTNTNTGLTNEQQEIFDIGQRINARSPVSVASSSSPTIGDNVTYSTPDPAESPFAAERAARQAQVGQSVNTTLVANDLYAGGVVRQVVPVSGTLTTTNQSPTLTEQINSVAQANGVDPNAPLTAQEQEIFDIGQRVNNVAPAPVSAPTNFGEVYNPETGLYDVYDFNNPDTPVATGLTEQGAILASQDLGIQEPAIVLNSSAAGVNPDNFPGYDDDGNLLPGYELDGDEQPYFAGFGPIQTNAADVNLANFPGYDDDGNLLPGYTLDEGNNPIFIGGGFVEPTTQAQADADRAAALRNQARQQQTISQQRKQINNGDWRVRLRLAPQSKYLYNAPQPGIMQPLAVTDGIIFPYTPAIDTAYRANYSAYDLTHSNYRGYFYQNSYVDAINLRATFTAQDTAEANYLLAVITFLKSATKMFYGQDAQRGAPPPLVYLSGLGEYQYNEHSCLIQQFNYNLPADVDYVRAGSGLNVGVSQVNQRDRQSVATNGLVGVATRLAAAFLTKGAIPNPLAPATLGLNRPTYVPTKMEISMTLLPVQSRQQVTKQFSVKEFANGNLIKGGFW